MPGTQANLQQRLWLGLGLESVLSSKIETKRPHPLPGPEGDGPYVTACQEAPAAVMNVGELSRDV